ncbi:hypothetical protein [Olleya sp. HaHaR_3_96]|uniref:hypothetical protein n=1 Tax=Olleya sp. HaHaR_3_96 TaxID=2745560 RepID=UPI001C4FD882|nr:hypothetical protein [Olleya sp. HaHaR_3_96]QXP59476.1 hypothetical protein H0I26_16395 [Olleya sp. HaHaR_3_96]
MKVMKLMVFLLIFTSCAIQKNKKNVDYKDVTLNIKTKKTLYKSNRWVKLYIVIKNNSNQDIIILKPSNEYGYQMGFYNVKYQCEEQSITEATELPVIKKTEADLITVMAKSEIELELKGNLYDVICNSSKITQVKIYYDTTKDLSEWIINKIGAEHKMLKDKLTKLKIESNEITIE